MYRDFQAFLWKLGMVALVDFIFVCVYGVHVCMQVSLYGGGGCACVCLMEVNTGCLSIALHFNLRQGF